MARGQSPTDGVGARDLEGQIASEGGSGSPGAREKEAAISIERTSAAGNLAEVFERVLDKGIVIDAWVRVSLAGIDLITVEARVVVAAIETYLRHSDPFGSRLAFCRELPRS